MLFNTLTFAAIVSLLASTTSAQTYKKVGCIDGSAAANMHLSWFPELEIPPTPSTANEFDAHLTKKLANHNVEFDMAVHSNNNVWMNIYNGHGDQQFYRVNFLREDRTKIHSYMLWSRAGGCDGMVDIPVHEVKHVTVEMAKGV